MKIRKAYPFLYLFLGVWIISGSCTKLEVPVYDQVLETSFVPTEKDIPNIIGPVYTQMRGMMASWQGMFDLQEEPADIIVNGHPRSGNRKMPGTNATRASIT